VKDFTNKVAAITGAGSGIGRALAVDLARRGAHLAISDLNMDGLAETVAQVQKARPSVKVTSAKLDVADREAMFAWSEQVVTEHGKANLIFNNAGVALAATIEQMKIEDFEWLMGINFWGVVHGTQAFLPHLKEAGEGHVINISSVFGLVPIPSQAAYNAAKFGVRGFTEALRVELDMANNGVSATCVHPGGIKTNIARNARMHVDEGKSVSDLAKATRNLEKAFITSPEKAATQILRAVEVNRRRALIGPDAHVFNLLGRLPASVTQPLIARGAKRGM
jgi:short-subunit dehydrogenase